MIVQYRAGGIHVYESALFRTVMTLVEGDGYLLLVDPNWLPAEVEFLAAETERLRAGRRLYLLFTHSDYDHIIGYGRFPEATTIASAAFTTNPEVDKVLTQIRDFDDAYYLERSYPIVYPAIDLVVGGATTSLRLGEEEVRFLPADGHNRDGMLTWFPGRGVLIVGDYLSNIEFPYVYHGVGEYRATLDRLETLLAGGEVRLLITGHGDATTDPAEMHRRLVDSRRYLAELETSVRQETPFNLTALFARYRFPKVMGEFHAGNVQLMECYVAENPE